MRLRFAAADDLAVRFFVVNELTVLSCKNRAPRLSRGPAPQRRRDEIDKFLPPPRQEPSGGLDGGVECAGHHKLPPPAIPFRHPAAPTARPACSRAARRYQVVLV